MATINAEDKILELLAEYLQKTDRLLDRMAQTDKNVDIMSLAMAEHSQKFNTVQEDIRQLQVAQNRMQSEHGILIQELLSLAKRVTKLED